MSGGAFDYKQFQIEDIVREIQDVLKKKNNLDTKDKEQDHEVRQKLRQAIKILRVASDCANEVDLLLSGDNSGTSFLDNWAGFLKRTRGKKSGIRFIFNTELKNS